MKHLLLASLITSASLVCSHAAEVGKAAPDFSVKDLNGKTVSLKDFKDKIVVLEWNNFDCPFVHKHYSSGNVPTLQGTYTEKGVVWLTVNSSAAGSEGHDENEALQKRAEKEGNKATAFLMDTDGKMGKAYDAKVTPHMYIIAKDGTLSYSGAMDSMATTENADIEKADKFFVDALDAVIAGKKVENSKNQPYGCAVKY